MADLTRLLTRIVQEGRPPPELDLDFYRLVHADLSHMDDAALGEHYRNHGRAEGRFASPSAHRSGFLALIPRDAEVLEIGPFTKPSVRGPRVAYFDVLDRKGLLARAAREGQPTDSCPEIEFVSPTGDLSVVDRSFDAVLSSHCIEHQPDLVAHLRAVERLLRPGGRYFMMVPDKRYCFDSLLPESTLDEVLAAHSEGRTVHAYRSVYEHRVLTTHNDSGRHWAGDSADPRADRRAEREAAARAEYEAAAGGYVDVHAWQFTPASLRDVVGALADRGLTGLRVERAYETIHGSHEFAAILTKGPQA